MRLYGLINRLFIALARSRCPPDDNEEWEAYARMRGNARSDDPHVLGDVEVRLISHKRLLFRNYMEI